jgi:hypothetical protein
MKRVLREMNRDFEVLTRSYIREQSAERMAQFHAARILLRFEGQPASDAHEKAERSGAGYRALLRARGDARNKAGADC